MKMITIFQVFYMNIAILLKIKKQFLNYSKFYKNYNEAVKYFMEE